MARSLSPERLEGVGIARQREDALDEPALDPEQEHLVELERASVPRPARAVEGRSAIVAREDVDELGAVGAVRLLRELHEKPEDRLPTLVETSHDAAPGNRPDGVLGEQPTEGESLLPGERIEDP